MTSNKAINDLFKDRPEMIEPLERRFTSIWAFNGTINGEDWKTMNKL